MTISTTNFGKSKLGFIYDTDGTASGMQVSPDTNLTVSIAAGRYWLGGNHVVFSADSATLSTAHASLARIDVLYVDADGNLSTKAGTPAASPVPPSVPTDILLLAQITVAAGATSITAANIQDLRDISFFTVSLSPPIGSIIAWHKTLTGTPALPAGWVECAGQVLSDVDSVYNGQTIPNLQGGRRFLAGSTTSGGTGTQDFLPVHTHTATDSGHTHEEGTLKAGSASGSGTGVTTSGSASSFPISIDGATASSTANITVQNSGAAGTVWNFTNMVYIMRVK